MWACFMKLIANEYLNVFALVLALYTYNYLHFKVIGLPVPVVHGDQMLTVDFFTLKNYG